MTVRRSNSSSSSTNGSGGGGLKSVSFPEDDSCLATVFVIPLETLSSAALWFQKEDYYKFKTSARRVAKEWRKRGLSPLLKDTYEEPDSPHTQQALLIWSQQPVGTPSRRGLENMINKSLCQKRRHKVVQSIVLAQTKIQAYGFDASMQARELALISEVYSERARVFAWHMGIADAAVVQAELQSTTPPPPTTTTTTTTTTGLRGILQQQQQQQHYAPLELIVQMNLDEEEDDQETNSSFPSSEPSDSDTNSSSGSESIASSTPESPSCRTKVCDDDEDEDDDDELDNDDDDDNENYDGDDDHPTTTTINTNTIITTNNIINNSINMYQETVATTTTTIDDMGGAFGMAVSGNLRDSVIVRKRKSRPDRTTTTTTNVVVAPSPATGIVSY